MIKKIVILLAILLLGLNAKAYDSNSSRFAYDSLNRLTGYGSKPYAVSRVADGGNFGTIAEQTVQYTSFQRPAAIAQGADSVLFTYHAGGDRVKMVQKTNHTITFTRYYLGGSCEVDVGGPSKICRLYVGGDAYSAPMVRVKENKVWKTYYIGRDYLGSIVTLYDSAGNPVEQNYYDAWGNLGNYQTQAIYPADDQPTLLLGRGYTGHEHLPGFGLINMNARLYDPMLGRFLAPDPYVQAPEFSQSFNRYSYAFNNPLLYLDPSGEWFLIDDLIAAVVGGVTNVISNWKNIDSFWQGLSLFGVGAGGGVISIYATPVAGAAFIGGGNSFINQGFTNGWKNINYNAVLGSTIMGGATSYLGGHLNNFISPYIGKLTSKIASPVFEQISNNVISNSTVGFGLGTGVSLLNGDDWSTALSLGFDGALLGITTGFITGTITGLQQAHKERVNPWSGKEKIEITAEDLGLSSTMDRISNGESHPHKNDGSFFENNKNILPGEKYGYYKEYVHPTPGAKGVGPQRIVTGSGGEYYYTPDHYKTFIRFKY